MAANTALILYVAARLPLAAYGLFVAVAGAQVILSRAVLAGTDGGVVRLSSASGGFARPECIGAGVVILRRTATIAILCSAAAALIPLPWPAWIPPVVAAGGIGIALVDYGYFCRLARVDYRSASAVQCIMGGLRLAAVVAADLVWHEQPVAVFIAYAAGSLSAGLLQFRTAARSGSPPAAGLVRRLFRYSAWQATASVLATGALNVGTFVLLGLEQKDAAGVFGLGLSLSLPFFFLYNAFYEFLLPRISHVPELKALRPAVLAWTGVALGLAAACIPVAVVAGLVFPRLFRPELAAAVPVFYWLAGSNALLLVQAVFEAASHALLRPVYVAATWAVRLAATAGGVFVLAHGGDAEAGGVGQFLASIAALALISALVAGEIGRRRSSADVAARAA